MNASELPHNECVKVLRAPERSHYCWMSIDGRHPVRLACLVRDDGDLLIPATIPRPLIAELTWRPVTVEFHSRAAHGPSWWTVTGKGLARPLSMNDLPKPLPHTTILSSDPESFRHGLRVLVARYTGQRAIGSREETHGPGV
ncbi:hypothetical protein [Amycolatopsis thermoflava]|uniref:hypothetical protein n=1 Tax=Amycolatopsis thermoflava TaxID=84480 RepID=UPI0012F9CFBF|nr:hypothetical protein [Amycolatopsis thermoflava]